jgi:hypothetical protein
MKQKTCPEDQFSQEERQLIERLRRLAEMMARVQSILELARNEGALKTADEVEELLFEEMRQLGNTTQRGWSVRLIRSLTCASPEPTKPWKSLWN